MKVSASKPVSTVPKIQFFSDHIIAEDGTRWALSCDWWPGICDLIIPDFLIVSQEDRAKAWKDRVTAPPSPPIKSMTPEEWKQERKRLKYTPEQREKNAAKLAGLKAKHAGEKYDRKLKVWVKCDGEVKPASNGTSA